MGMIGKRNARSQNHDRLTDGLALSYKKQHWKRISRSKKGRISSSGQNLGISRSGHGEVRGLEPIYSNLK